MFRLVILISISLSLAACTAGTPAPVAPCDHAHTHAHSDGANAESKAAHAPDAGPAVVPHAGLRAFVNNGNSLTGIATRSHGAQSFEVWRSSIGVGNSTPLHKHESEEVFVVLQGSGEVRVGEQVIPFAAPATVIAPAGIPHQLRNTGTEAIEQIVIVGAGSTIYDADGKPMNLPWRK